MPIPFFAPFKFGREFRQENGDPGAVHGQLRNILEEQRHGEDNKN
jgi:hypothetical protein